MVNANTKMEAEYVAKNRAIAEYRIKLQAVVVERDQWQSCMNCEHFTETFRSNLPKKRQGEPDNFCLKFQAVPPASVIVNGCSDHEMEIPF